MEELLHQWNPWWDGDEVPHVSKGMTRRDYLPNLLEQTAEDRISVVTGPRRSGKTTLMHQVIDSLLTSGTKPKNILFAQLDHPGLNTDIGGVVREYRKINKIQRSEKVFLFLDEAQYSADWAGWAKALFDTRGAKLFISGSTTALLEKDAHASLTGRWRRNLVWPLSFTEFLEFRKLKANKSERYLESSYLKEYVTTGGFPEVVREESARSRARMLVELFDDMVLKDAARTREFRDVESLRSVAVFMTASVGTPVSMNKMKNTFKISIDAISNYIDALCGAYLFLPCQYYSRSVNERTYNSKKYYMIDTGMASAVLGKTNFGVSVENLLALHYMKKGEVRYWKSGGELDFVLGQGETALESKFGKNVSVKDVKTGIEFAKKNRLEDLWVATDEQKGTEETDGVSVHFVPSSRILLGEEGPGQDG